MKKTYLKPLIIIDNLDSSDFICESGGKPGASEGSGSGSNPYSEGMGKESKTFNFIGFESDNNNNNK